MTSSSDLQLFHLGGARLEPLLLRTQRSRMRRFRPQLGGLSGEAFRARATGGTRWRDRVSWLARERLGIPLEGLDEVAGETEVWWRMDGWTEEWMDG